jgi:hypothetical protein
MAEAAKPSRLKSQKRFVKNFELSLDDFFGSQFILLPIFLEKFNIEKIK